MKSLFTAIREVWFHFNFKRKSKIQGRVELYFIKKKKKKKSFSLNIRKKDTPFSLKAVKLGVICNRIDQLTKWPKQPHMQFFIESVRSPQTQFQKQIINLSLTDSRNYVWHMQAKNGKINKQSNIHTSQIRSLE